MTNLRTRALAIWTCLFLVATWSTQVAAQPGPAETVVSFDASRLETPESIAFDYSGNMYVSLALTGEIRKVTPSGVQSTHAMLPLGPPLTPCGSFVNIMGALAIDHYGTIYVTVNSCDPANRGVWSVSSSGAMSLVENLPPEALANGIAYRHHYLYVADSSLGVVWRMRANGDGAPEIWADDPLLAVVDATLPGSSIAIPGPNGIQFYGGEAYVVNPSTFSVIAIRVNWDGSAGTARVHATGIGGDDCAFDIFGNMYCTTDPFNTVEVIRRDGSREVLLTAADGLDGPTAAAFGKTASDYDVLYISNAAFPFFSTTLRPSVMRIDLGVPGLPRPLF